MIIRFNDKDLVETSYMPEGEHECVVAKLEEAKSKSGNDMLVVTLMDKVGRTEKLYFPVSDASKWKLARFAMACGIPVEALKANGLDVPNLRGKKVMILKKQSGTEMYEGKEKKRYETEFFKVNSGMQQQASSNFDDDPLF
jgi:hypothetical protein